jgi:hypothetical protein
LACMRDMVRFSLVDSLNVADNATDKPDEVLESDSKYPEGHKPVIGVDSPANK